MSRREPFLDVVWLKDWKASYAKLTADRQRACDDCAFALVKQDVIKPIQPEKYYFEARVNSGDRIIFRIEGGTIYFFDVVKHDDIGRYGRRPKRVGL